MHDRSFTEPAKTDVIRFVWAAPLLLLLALVFWRTGWLSDDAYISYRTVDNFVHGWGLRYNVFERVQTFTNPLWVFLNALPYALTREGFYTFIAVGVLTSVAAVAVAMAAVRSTAACVVLVLLLLSSRAFTDYSTSGMENPLTHLLLAAAVWVVWRRPAGARSVFSLSLLMALAAVNRLDAVLLFAPLVLYGWWQARSVRACAAGMAGLMPLLLWLAFSLAYYGFLFPNTAYAKVWAGLPKEQVLQNGLHYLLATFQSDPVTVLMLLAASALACWRASGRAIALAAGALIYVAYIVYVGGDFMLGRFFSAPVFLAALVLADAVGSRPWRFAVLAYAMAAVAALFMVPHAVLLDAIAHQAPAGTYYDGHGVWDMRLAFTHSSGIAYAKSGVAMPVHEYAESGRQLRATGKPKTGLYGAAGMRAFFAGPDLRLVDMHAITDPLLARLPPMDHPEAAIGHLRRYIVPGYLKSVETGENVIEDPAIKAMYADIKVVTQGPLLAAGRWDAMVRLNLRQASYGIDEAMLRVPRSK